MTFLDAIMSNPTFQNVPQTNVEAAFVGRGVEPTDDYTAAGLKSLELTQADLYIELATQAKVSEGQFSMEYNPKLLLQRARTIYARYSDPRLSETGGRTLDLNITKT